MKRFGYIFLALAAALLSGRSEASIRNNHLAYLYLNISSVPDTVNAPYADTPSSDSAAIEKNIPLSISDSLDLLFWTDLDTVTIPCIDSLATAFLDSLSRDLPDTSDIKRAIRQIKKEYRDSVRVNTPRVLETCAVPDSAYYEQILKWTVDTKFNDIRISGIDTSANYWFNDYPMFRKDINAEYLGVVGSPTQSYNFFKREEVQEAPAFTPYIDNSYTPGNLPQYNTKAPYTVLAYWGTPFATKMLEESELNLLSTQNITPAFNFSLAYTRYGGRGMLKNENTDNRTAMLGINYLGKRYVMNAGMIRQSVKRQENGGICDSFWIRDTIVDTKSIDVNLNEADNELARHTYFINHHLAIPMNFFRKDADSLALNDGTMAFVGHSGEFSTYNKTYTDQISQDDEAGRAFYFDRFYINPVSSHDEMDVTKLENRFFVKLQPFSPDAIISDVKAGIGYQILSTYNFRPSDYIRGIHRERQNNLFIYGGAKGTFRKYFAWEADGDYYYAGYRMFDFDLHGKVRFSVYPIEDGIHLTGKISTALKEPHPFQQEIFTNHHQWSNDFEKVSASKIEGELSIPHWKANAFFGYALLGNMLYYNTSSVIQQFPDPISVMTGYLRKDLKLWALHLDNKIIYQTSTDSDILPLPKFALNLRYYVEFNVVKDVMKMQLGVNALFTQKYYAPAYSPDLGVFFNQKEEKIGGVPYCDAFVNMQWKNASVFVKYTNAFKDWPESDYFSAYHYIRPCNSIKFGIYWPFYLK